MNSTGIQPEKFSESTAVADNGGVFKISVEKPAETQTTIGLARHFGQST